MAHAEQADVKESAKPEGEKQTGRFKLFTVAGIKITLDYSWLIIFLLVLWSLSAGYFPHFFPEYSTQTYWLAGFVATLLFFASIVLHELSHSLTAISYGVKIPEITLFLFGGVAHLSEDPKTPQMELKVAIAGPLTSLALAGVFWGIYNLVHGNTSNLITAIFEYLAFINLALAIFNLVPGYPLDGGRIFRALVWWKTGSIKTGTKWASDFGKGFAWALIFLGVLRIFVGALIGGLWLVFIGMFLRGIAASGYRDLVEKQSLEKIKVSNAMIDRVISAPPDITVREVVDNYFLAQGHGGFPVMSKERPVGLITLTQVKKSLSSGKESSPVSEEMIPLSDEITISPEASLLEASMKMNSAGVGRLIVMEDDEMKGLVTKRDLLRRLEVSEALQQ
jgi:Zn-dependent protease